MYHMASYSNRSLLTAYGKRNQLCPYFNVNILKISGVGVHGYIKAFSKCSKKINVNYLSSSKNDVAIYKTIRYEIRKSFQKKYHD